MILLLIQKDPEKRPNIAQIYSSDEYISWESKVKI